MGFLKIKKQDVQIENIPSKSLQEIYREKKRQLKVEQMDLESKQEQLEQDTRINALQMELDQIQQQIQDTRTRNKKRWIKIIVSYVILCVLVGFGMIIYKTNSEKQSKNQVESESETLEIELEAYKATIEEKKQELQLEIEGLIKESEELTQQLETIK